MATLYAQPTKEWVIPAKPKPGRKPKRDEPVADEEDGVSYLTRLYVYASRHCAMQRTVFGCDAGHMGSPSGKLAHLV